MARWVQKKADRPRVQASIRPDWWNRCSAECSAVRPALGTGGDGALRELPEGLLGWGPE